MRDGPIATVKACVAEHYGVTVNALVSARKERGVTGPRHIAMWLCRELTPFSPAHIGRQFGNRDRKTVVNAWERAEVRMAADPILKTEVEALADAIAAPGGVPAVSGSPVRDTAFALRNEAQALRESRPPQYSCRQLAGVSLGERRDARTGARAEGREG